MILCSASLCFAVLFDSSLSVQVHDPQLLNPPSQKPLSFLSGLLLAALPSSPAFPFSEPAVLPVCFLYLFSSPELPAYWHC